MDNRKKIEEILLNDYGCFDDFTVDKICDLFSVVGRSEQFSFADMQDAFRAGDKFRLYLDKNAVGLGHPHDKDIPTSDKVVKTMCFDKWIESKR